MRLPTHRMPTHPGEMLLEEYLKPLSLSRREVAQRLGLSRAHVDGFVRGRRQVTADTALRLARLFGTTPEFWLNGQLAWDLWHAMHSPRAVEIEKIQPLEAA